MVPPQIYLFKIFNAFFTIFPPFLIKNFAPIPIPRAATAAAGVPYLFSVVAMGFLLSGVSRLWTQYRYNQQTKNAQNPQKPQADFIKTSPVFKGIIEG